MADPFSIAGLILAVTSLINDLRTAQGHEKQFRLVWKILENQKHLFSLMAETKDIHDQFEKFKMATEGNFKELEKWREVTPKQLESKLDFILKNENSFMQRRDLSIVLQEEDRNFLDVKEGELRAHFKEPIRKLKNYYPHLKKMLHEYNENIGDLRSYRIEGNYGNLENKAIVLANNIDETRSSADSVLINTIPILRYFHDDLMDASKSFQ